MRATVSSERNKRTKAMDKRLYRTSVLVAVIAATIAFFFSYQVALGILIGTVFFGFYLYLLTRDIDRQLTGNNGSRILTVIFKMLRLSLFAAALAIGAVWPQYVNIFGVFGGLMSFKVCTIIDAIIHKG
jgi:uncharacterized membrane protein